MYANPGHYNRVQVGKSILSQVNSSCCIWCVVARVTFTCVLQHFTLGLRDLFEIKLVYLSSLEGFCCFTLNQILLSSGHIIIVLKD